MGDWAKLNIKFKKNIVTFFLPIYFKLCRCFVHGLKMYMDLHSLSTHSMCRKINVTIISKSHAHLQAINKASAKFQKDQKKDVREAVALTH